MVARPSAGPACRVRPARESLGKGGLTFGPAKVTAKNTAYRAVLDYANADAIPVTFSIQAQVNGTLGKLSDARAQSLRIDAYKVDLVDQNIKTADIKGDLVTIPVYVGIGMRLSADVTALEGGIPPVSLGTIGLEAQAKRLTGTLTIQTIGITGESVAAALPLPSKLDQTTIENGILSIGDNRAVVYKRSTDGGGIVTTPRVVSVGRGFEAVAEKPAAVSADLP